LYYEARYAGHNLARAKNQFKLLDEYEKSKEKFGQLMGSVLTLPHNIGNNEYYYTKMN
jgi:hypothetical protein